jgi:hypothetical protein
VGPLYHRRYWVDFKSPESQEAKILQVLIKNINTCSPTLLAEFQKTKGPQNDLKVGDEFLIKINGPWDGPVRVTDRTPNSFEFQTLKGHLEAGRIQFSVSSQGKCPEDGSPLYRLMIESFARSQNAWVDFFYDKIPIIRWVQKMMWTSFCRKFVRDVLPKCSPASSVCERTVQL